ncbi:alpha-D-ribose 1-methylphosphonate 5-triphosphate diphosphatase [Rhizobium halophytocola]|uniref:Alpha-D-ribose 1-methylphosphonate 5-triphosphate diphosphatase n=1 Tax=Rhizobium halophytocola TaxID=735519 RepID=A0ABS4DTM0_9HYPH|nr:alpha-D-ribose 1-methylphosphonate 5-triphosphate diphosphatase [Rhizobium halophytocola]MBP1849045.1 alpha-D-ribose 1-methylphosphonate 5-triphosphate diphosphatase [Rhizobium halophytocola]
MTTQDDPTGAGTPLVLANAKLVLVDRIVLGSLVVRDGRIEAVEESGAAVPAGALDLGGDYLIPGLVDLHTDHFEKHIFPRFHVRWDYVRAALAHDAQIIGGGVTTVFDSLAVGNAEGDSRRSEILKPMIDALERATAGGMLRAQHLVHLRCEVIDPKTPALVQEVIDHPLVRIASVMEHLPGIRQTRDLEGYIARMADIRDQGVETTRDQVMAMIAEKSEIGRKVRPEVVALAKARGLPLLSHDDTDIAHVDLAADEGVAISEFPCSLEAAREARLRGMATVGGAPNILRGQSQSGNVAMKELMDEGLLDILASDYVPRSMLDAAFLITDSTDFAEDLPAAIRMVAKAPAEAAGLADRGEITAGRRADLVHIGLFEGHPFPKMIWREGIRVA